MALTASLIAGGLAAGSSLLNSASARKSAKRQAEAYQQAINLMREEAARKLTGLYGGSAGSDGVSTGNATQDVMLRLLAQRVNDQEVKAANINLASQLMTDKEARDKAYLDAVMTIRDNASRQLGNAAKWNRRYGGDDAKLLLEQSKETANDVNNAYNLARFAKNDNLQRIGQGANLNTGSVGDAMRQEAQGLNSQYQNNRAAAISNLANLTTAQGMTKAKAPSSGQMWGDALMSGLSGGINAYGQAQLNDEYMNLLRQMIGAGNTAPQASTPSWANGLFDSKNYSGTLDIRR